MRRFRGRGGRVSKTMTPTEQRASDEIGTAIPCRGHLPVGPGRSIESLARAASAIIAASEQLLAVLMQMAEECAAPGWDGDGAAAIQEDVVRRASAFIRAIPEGTPLPEISPAPDGSILLDWALSKHRLFSLIVGESDRLAYAWLDGADKGHGVARFALAWRASDDPH